MGVGFPPPPPLVEAAVQPVVFPQAVQAQEVRAMAAGGGRLWMAVRATERVAVRAVDPALARNVAPAETETVRLWSVSLAGGVPTRVGGPLSTNRIDDLALIGDELWCVTDGNGLAALHWASGRVRRFFDEPDLEPPSLRLVAGTTNHLFVLGEQLRLSTDLGRSWQVVAEPALGRQTPWRTGHDRPVDRLVMSGENLGVWIGRALALDPVGRRWTCLDETLVAAGGLFPLQTGAGDGAGSFWLAGAAGAAEVAPSQGVLQRLVTEPALEMQLAGGDNWTPSRAILGATRKVPPGWKPHLQSLLERRRGGLARGFGRIPGPINGIAVDGDWLWLACADPQRSLLLLYQRSERQWVAGILLPHHPPRHVVIAGDWLWLGGYGDHSVSPLHQVQRAPLVAIPRDRWVSAEAGRDELLSQLDARPSAANAMAWLLAGHPEQVAVWWQGEDEEDLLPEQLFGLTLAFDELGLKQPERSRRLREQLFREYPDSIFTAALKEDQRPAPALEAHTANRLASEEAQLLPEQRRPRFDLERRLREIPAEARAILAAYDKNGNQSLERSEVSAVFRSEPGRIPFVRPNSPNPGITALGFSSRYLGSPRDPVDLDRLVAALEQLARDQAAGRQPRPPQP